MKTTESKYFRILGISLSTRGFGFAVLEGQEKLVDWGVKSIQGDKNTCSIVKVRELIIHYQPVVIILEGTLSKHSRRSARIQVLIKGIVTLVKSLNVKVALFSREQVMHIFFAQGKGTKHTRAEIIAARFSEELASRLPPKRRPWMSEDYRMNIFDAVALALAFQLKKKVTSSEC